MVGIKKKLDRREATRERKALAAAHLEKSIEKELLERLRSKAYGEAPLNVNEDVWRQVLDMDRKGKAKEQGIELEDELEDMMDDESLYDEDESDDEDSDGDEEGSDVGSREFVDSDDESGDDMEDYGEDDEDDEGMDFPSDLEVSDEDDEDEDAEEEDGAASKRKGPAKTNGKAPAPALGKRKGGSKEKKGGKQRMSYLSLCFSRSLDSQPSDAAGSSVGTSSSHRSPCGHRVRNGDRANVARIAQELVNGRIRPLLGNGFTKCAILLLFPSCIP